LRLITDLLTTQAIGMMLIDEETIQASDILKVFLVLLQIRRQQQQLNPILQVLAH
jgi:hypothetical protein